MSANEIIPEILILKDEEKFADIDGNIVDIEVRGTFDIDNIYYKLEDIRNNLKIYDIYFPLEEENNFYEDKHFKKFTINNNVEYFLTFKGLMKFLYLSDCVNADNYTNFMNYIMFYSKRGTDEQKQDIISNLFDININLDMVKKYST